MFALNLPRYTFKIKNINGKQYIFDDIRSKWITLTPEEWVRQNFAKFLLFEKKFPRERFVNEASINVNGQKKRCDSVLFDIDLTPQVIIEYKAPEIKINQKVFEQINSYNWILKAKYLIISNGMNHYCCKIDYQNNTYVFLEDIPCYGDL
jgi:hypothetical protein